MQVEEDGRGKNLIGIAGSASQGEVSQKQFENRPFSRNGELVEVVPGAIATQHSGSGKANQYFLRGFNLDHGTDFTTFVDGIPMNMTTHAHGQGYMDINSIIPELVKRSNTARVRITPRSATSRPPVTPRCSRWTNWIRAF